MLIEPWILVTVFAILIGVILREILENRKLAKDYKMASIIIGYMQLRFKYIPTLKDIEKGVGLTDSQIASVVKD